jgi:hypothetical protein
MLRCGLEGKTSSIGPTRRRRRCSRKLNGEIGIVIAIVERCVGRAITLSKCRRLSCCHLCSMPSISVERKLAHLLPTSASSYFFDIDCFERVERCKKRVQYQYDRFTLNVFLSSIVIR